MENEKITITMEEYKELLITKGKYEELKSQQGLNLNYPLVKDTTKEIERPYKLTCKN